MQWEAFFSEIYEYINRIAELPVPLEQCISWEILAGERP